MTDTTPGSEALYRFSALGRAVGDETPALIAWWYFVFQFQCSRSSRGG